MKFAVGEAIMTYKPQHVKKYHLMCTFNEDSNQPAQAHSQGPVVQSVVSLTSSLRVISLTVLADSIYNTLIFFAEKM